MAQALSNPRLPLGTPVGKLALEGGQRLALQVLQSNAGYYLGTFDEEGPYSRESAEYWPTPGQAEAAMSSGEWTQRDHP
jgi:hypothetical protein